MSVDEKQLAPPQLYGAPAYSRPSMVVRPAERPFDLDELPIDADRTEEERQFASTLSARSWAPGGVQPGDQVSTETGPRHGLRPRRFSLRAIAGRILGGG